MAMSNGRSRAVKAAVAFAAGMFAAAAAVRGRRRQRRLHEEVRVQSRRDAALADSFPASDPPATQNFDIPANRREPNRAS